MINRCIIDFFLFVSDAIVYNITAIHHFILVKFYGFGIKSHKNIDSFIGSRA